MNILVVGATGRTGRYVVEQGIARGHVITALTRKPDRLTNPAALAGVIEGDARDLSTVVRALQGQDAVISAVGASAIAMTLIRAMGEQGVRRLVMTSSRSIVATRPRLPVALAWMFFRNAYADLARAEGMLQSSALDWTIVRATMLTNKPMTGSVHVDSEANATGGEATLARADYAMTLLDAVEDASMIRKAIGVNGASADEKARSHAAW